MVSYVSDFLCVCSETAVKAHGTIVSLSRKREKARGYDRNENISQTQVNTVKALVINITTELCASNITQSECSVIKQTKKHFKKEQSKCFKTWKQVLIKLT